MNQQHVSLDISKSQGVTQMVRIGQGDKSGTTIVATVYDNGTAFDMTGMAAKFLMRTPGNAYVEDESVTVNGNTLTYVVDEEHCASTAGVTDECYFQILQGETVIASTSRFSMRVLRAATQGADPAHSYSDDIVSATTAARQAANDAREAMEEIGTAVEDAAQAAESAAQAVEGAAQAVEDAQTAIADANSAKQAATSAANAATTAANAATTAANNANTAANAANTAATAANSAATAANTAAENANTAAENADTKAQLAETATASTNEATAQANAAAEDATLAAAQARGAVSANLRFSIDIVEIDGARRLVFVDAGESEE